MKITRDNYESFFIDYMEGNLPESMIDQFLYFLNLNPDLKEELNLFEEVNLSEETVVFQEKKQLHKSGADEKSRFENIAIAYLEGDLDADENKTAENYLFTNPEFIQVYDLIAKTQLKPDFTIKYPDKRKLYQKSGATIVMNWVARVAAVLVLIWGINSLIQTQNTQESGKRNIELAEVSPKPTTALPELKKDLEMPVQKITIPKKGKVKAAQPTKRIKETQPVIPAPTARELTTLTTVLPIEAQFEFQTEAQLAFSHSDREMKINESAKSMNVGAFLANRVQRVSKNGLFSAQRIARLGLDLASEISGERIGYQTKDGKITSVDFESKLMAFSIPLEKK
jgi:hypothetical protein